MLEGLAVLVRLGYVVELELLAGRVVGCVGTVRLMTVGVLDVFVLMWEELCVSVREFTVGLTVVEVGTDWF